MSKGVVYLVCGTGAVLYCVMWWRVVDVDVMLRMASRSFDSWRARRVGSSRS